MAATPGHLEMPGAPPAPAPQGPCAAGTISRLSRRDSSRGAEKLKMWTRPGPQPVAEHLGPTFSNRLQSPGPDRQTDRPSSHRRMGQHGAGRGEVMETELTGQQPAQRPSRAVLSRLPAGRACVRRTARSELRPVASLRCDHSPKAPHSAAHRAALPPPRSQVCGPRLAKECVPRGPLCLQPVGPMSPGP